MGECDVAFAASGRPAITPWPTGRWDSASSTTSRSPRRSWRRGASRVAIVDWDVHHGNGTQDIFYDDERVLYVSTHESPAVPGHGPAARDGRAECADVEPQPAVPGRHPRRRVPPGVRRTRSRRSSSRFAPDWLLISAGFDAHRNDPLAGLELTAADFADLAVRLQALAPARRTVVVLEGGYDFDALSMSTGATLSAMIGEGFDRRTRRRGDIGLPSITAAKQRWDLR